MNKNLEELKKIFTEREIIDFFDKALVKVLEDFEKRIDKNKDSIGRIQKIMKRLMKSKID